MNKETILQEKANKYFVYFDENQKKAILEAMEFYKNYYPKTFDLSIITNDLVNYIRMMVSNFYGVDLNIEKSRTDDVVKVRRVFYYFVKKYTKLSLKNIGLMLITRQPHCTVLIGIKEVKKTMDVYPAFVEEIKHLDNLIKIKSNELNGL